jgi:hypothetical protein
VLGRSAAIAPVSGTVFVGAGEDRERLTERTIIPLETQVDATDGRVALSFATTARGEYQSGDFWDGAFTIHQGTRASVAELRLVGEAPEVRYQARAAAARKRKRKRRRLWGSARGEFRTTGRHGAATVRGTRWLTEDRSTGTFIRVTEGAVFAEAFERADRRIVRAGESFLARPACVSRRNFRIRLRLPVGTRVRSARVFVNGRRAPVRRGRRYTARIDLRGVPQGLAEVRIRIVTARGAVLREVRDYQTCAGVREAG